MKVVAFQYQGNQGTIVLEDISPVEFGLFVQFMDGANPQAFAHAASESAPEAAPVTSTRKKIERSVTPPLTVPAEKPKEQMKQVELKLAETPPEKLPAVGSPELQAAAQKIPDTSFVAGEQVSPELMAAPTFRIAMQVLRKQGLKTPEAVIAEFERVRAHVPVFAKIEGDPTERVTRAMVVLDTEEKAN